MIDVAPSSDAVYSRWRIASIGDLDGDGTSDLVLQTTFDPTTAEFRPRAWFVSGRQDRILFALQRPIGDQMSPDRADGGGLFRIEPLEDVDADSVGDFAVCIPDSCGTEGGAGVVQVYSGSRHTSLYRSMGDNYLDSFGNCLTRIGDVDGDGICDVLAGTAILSFSPEKPVPGLARALSGASGKILWKALGPLGENSFSELACATGDFDQDGIPDCVIAAPSALELAGRVSIHSGKNGSELYVLQGNAEASEFLGSTLDPLEDVDDDGCADVLIGRFQAPSRILSVRKKTWIDPPWQLYWARAVGDLDSDGRTDVAGWEGRRGWGGELLVLSARDGRELLRLRPEPGFDSIQDFGGIGDLDGDGHGDLWVLSDRESEWKSGNYEPVFGSIAIHSGADGSILRRFDRETVRRMAAEPHPMIMVE